MGGGGASGTIQFPVHISDWHGMLIAGREVNASTGRWVVDYTKAGADGLTNISWYQYADGTTAGMSFSEYWDIPKYTVTRVLNDMLVGTIAGFDGATTTTPSATGSPYTGFSFTDPSSNLADIESYFALASDEVSTYVARSYGDYVTSALLAASLTTAQIQDLTATYAFTSAASVAVANISTVTEVFNLHSSAVRAQLDDYTDLIHTEVGGNLGGLMASAATSALHALSMTAFTTLWEEIVDQVNVKLSDCAIPKNVNTLAILTKAAKDTDANLKAAVRLAKEIINGDLLSDVTEQFAARRETAYQAQVSDFAGTMADLNAVNSTAFLWGVALLRSEQMREVAEFDSQLSLQTYQQAIESYIQARAQDLQVGLQAELANAGAHNQLLSASIQLMAALKNREEITPVQVLSLWGAMYNSEVAAFTQLASTALAQTTGIYGSHLEEEFRRESKNADLDLTIDQLGLDADKLNLQALSINKEAKEQRYLTGLGETGKFFANKASLRASLSQVREKQKMLRIAAEREYEAHSIDLGKAAAFWDLDAMRAAADILTAPAGMAAAIPKQPGGTQQAIGYAFQAASIITSLL